jgi:hypothetical protein
VSVAPAFASPIVTPENGWIGVSEVVAWLDTVPVIVGAGMFGTSTARREPQGNYDAGFITKYQSASVKTYRRISSDHQ